MSEIKLSPDLLFFIPELVWLSPFITRLAVAIHKKGGGVFIDVRDSADIAKSGTVASAHRIPRGFIVFAADDSLPCHNAALKKDVDIYLVCGLGGQAALAEQKLKEMRFTSVTNIGGFNDWKETDGPTKKA